ncbi:hypothetical protein Corgl_1748 [Coriobacterium glomerans PW2]|uniref:Cytidylate kinase n=1 Tax=Coriobacterium glomerans (strain ATCC 49209 / DSM 20642 / JCM 10262 / PW2) TaxID=700015 RepID=F2N995_CORGP|nr:cytidylate kinase-like family protein [Coriobacterium glomerans]AEB07843.1 hypothetical protein Corgl_1748 [Coriobacterium glomerans PW2]
MSIKSKIEALAPGGPSAVIRAGQPVVITITRDFGAEAHEIGKMLSNELEIPLYDNEILVRSALRAGESIEKMADYDERLTAEFMAFMPDRVDARTLADKLFEKMSEVIVDLGSTESCIIEGRLSDYLLRCNPNQIAVLVTAPLADRIEIVRRNRGLTRRKAATLVKQMQRAREHFYRRYSAGRWKMRTDKDLIVNRAKLGRQGCVDVIAAAYRAKAASLGIYEEESAIAVENDSVRTACEKLEK